MPKQDTKRDSNLHLHKGVKFDIENGPVFQADEIGVMHNPTKLIMDFRSITPRIDIRNRSFQPIVIKHNVVTLDIHTAKTLLNILKTNINNYEKRFGKITKPKALVQAEKEAKDNVKKGKGKFGTKEMPNYFG